MTPNDARTLDLLARALAFLSGANAIAASAFSPDGKYIASAIDSNAAGVDVQIWNAASEGLHEL